MNRGRDHTEAPHLAPALPVPCVVSAAPAQSGCCCSFWALLLLCRILKKKSTTGCFFPPLSCPIYQGTSANPGINQRALQLLFSEVRSKASDWDYAITVSVAEIYNEALRYAGSWWAGGSGSWKFSAGGCRAARFFTSTGHGHGAWEPALPWLRILVSGP